MGVMPRRSSGFVFALVCLLVVGETWLILGGSASAASVNGVYFLTGTPEDQANQLNCPDDPCTRSASFSSELPTGTTPIFQQTDGAADEEVSSNGLAAFWTGPYKGNIDGEVEICWFWASPNASSNVLADLLVLFFADPGTEDEKIIANVRVPATFGPTPTEVISTVPVSGSVKSELQIQVKPNFIDIGRGYTVHYGYEDALSAFGPPGTGCPTEGGEPTPTQTSTATSPPSQTTNATGPGVGLRMSDPTPERGTIVKAKGSLRKCPGHQGTKLHLQKKKDGKFRQVAVKKLNKRCRATFRIRATFKRATFRAFWPKQDRDHRRGRSKPRTITTHR